MKNLNKRKALAAKVLGVGKGRIILDETKLAEIKEAITKQDIRDFYEQGIIRIRDSKGRLAKDKRTTRRGPGKIKLKIKPGKRAYITLTRKLRKYLKEIKKQGKINPDKYLEFRKKIKAKMFKDKQHLKDHMEGKE